MRLERLDLERVGSFTERSLNFAPPGALSVVYGPNEAGKSTALRAVSALFYGFGQRAGDLAHGFAQNKLLVGGAFSRADGAQLTARRRKGRDDPLMDADGAPLPPDALDAFLAGADRDAFEMLFGLDAERLRDGGRELLETGGAFGRSLLSASAALGHAKDLGKRLQTKADDIYTPRRAKNSVKSFALALERRDAAAKTLREASLGLDAWRAAEDAAAEARAALDAARQEAAAAEKARDAAARAARAAPLLSRLDHLRAAAKTHPAANAPDGAGMGIEAALTGWLSTREAGFAAAERAERAQKAAAAAEAPTQTLARQTDIEALAEPLDAAQAAQRGAPERLERAAKAAMALERVAAGCGAAPETLNAAAPTASELATWRRLAAEGQAAAAAEAAAQERLTKLLRQPGAAAAETLDDAALKELDRLWTSARSAPQLKERAEQLEKDAREAEKQAHRLARELPLIKGAAADKLKRLAESAPPPSSEIDRVAAAWTEAEDAARTRAAKREALTSRLEAAEARSAEAGGTDAPSSDAVRVARDARDALWRDVVATAYHGRLDAAPAADAVTARISQADALADARFAAAEGIAARDAAAAEVRKAHADLKALALSDKEAKQAGKERQAEWAALWPGLDHAPYPPEEMRRWIKDRSEALGAAAKTEELRAAADDARAPTEQAIAAVLDLAAKLGIERRGSGAPTAKQLAKAVEGIDKRRGAAQSAAEARRDAAAAAAALTAWRAAAAHEVGERTRGAASDPESFAAALAAWESAPAALAAVADAQREADLADARTAALREALAPLGLAQAGDPVQAAQQARAALAEDLKRHQKRTMLAEAAADAEAEAQAAQAAAGRAEERLRAQLASAGGDAEAAPDALGAAAQERSAQIAARDALRGEIAAVEDQALAAGGGYDEARLREELAAFAAEGMDGDALAREAAARDGAYRLARAAAEDAAGRAGEAEQARRALAEGDRAVAARAAQEREDAGAALRAAAEEWLPLHAAIRLLKTATRLYRARVGAPLLARASGHFAQLTGGAYEALEVGFDDKDQERIEARPARKTRGGAEALTIDQLSEGARDQLFLALRLAAIEDWAARRDAPPFIADDLLASFDDARAARALELLADLSDRVQTILFTHHRHVAELAKQQLGDRCAVLDLAA